MDLSVFHYNKLHEEEPDQEFIDTQAANKQKRTCVQIVAVVLARVSNLVQYFLDRGMGL